MSSLIWWGGQSYAAVAPPEQWSEIVEKKHMQCEDGNMSQMTSCMSEELAESDARLNLVYQTLLRALLKPQPLQAAQRAWLAYRDKECAFQTSSMEGGSGYSFSQDLCLLRFTERRIAELEQNGPCNGCVEFKPQFYTEPGFHFPPRTTAGARKGR